ncbi:DUF2933 domain-containing protein [Brevibacillus agri]|uniref:DUF2933 domain-containing protein n=1 Tax=Brevibacillus TaxID=55080 RepID=UPI00399CC573
MEWLSFLLLLACPLMMLLCMKGMNHRGHGDSGKTENRTELHELHVKIDELSRQNQQLQQDIQTMKGRQ